MLSPSFPSPAPQALLGLLRSQMLLVGLMRITTQLLLEGMFPHLKARPALLPLSSPFF